jgi:hypothetical protein
MPFNPFHAMWPAERAGGTPVECYTFQRGASRWYYTSHDVAQTIGGITFTPAVISRGAVEQQEETGGEEVKVTIGLEVPLASALRDVSGLGVTCAIQRLQPAISPVPLVLLGEVVQRVWRDAEVELTVATVERRLTQLIPRVLVSRTCQRALYDEGCGVDATAYDFATTVSSVSGQVVTVASVDGNPDGWYANGILAIGTERCFIVDQTGTALTLQGRIPAAVTGGASVTLYAGCDKLHATCVAKFNNEVNFLGFENLPTVNPSKQSMR